MKTTHKEYQVWCWKAPYSDNPDSWSSMYFDDIKDAYEYAGETVAEEIIIEVWADKGWVNDHIEQEKVLEFAFAK